MRRPTIASVAPRPDILIVRIGSLVARRYFRNSVDAIVSLVVLGVLVFGLIRFVDWAIVNSVWTADNATDCAARGSGACWAVLPARFRLVLFGVYPQADQWRAVIGFAVLLGSIVLTCIPFFWSVRRLVVLWLGSFAVFIGLMQGGLFGLSAVPTDNWGGLALTLLIFASAMIIGMPLAILLALARWSGPPWLRMVVGVVVDLVRSVPLTVILFSAVLALPLLLPGWLTLDKLYRVIIGFALFFAVYQSEILRGGLQAIGAGQAEAAEALGIRYWPSQFTVILPQVFRIALPQTVNQTVAAFKDTSYVAIVGFFDLVSSASAALGTGDWSAAYVEVYALVGLIYLVLGYSLSQYGSYLERRMGKAYRR